MFQFNHVSFRVPERFLLQDINIAFQPAQVYGLIGHNGSGKSTLLKLLVRQHRATSGEIVLDNKPIAQYLARDYAKQLAYLPQYLPAAASLTAEELVRMGRYAWTGLTGCETDTDREAVERAFVLVRDLSRQLNLGVVVVIHDIIVNFKVIHYKIEFTIIWRRGIATNYWRYIKGDC